MVGSGENLLCDEDAPQEAKLFWDILQKHCPVVASKVEECILGRHDARVKGSCREAAQLAASSFAGPARIVSTRFARRLAARIRMAWRAV